MKLTQSWLMVSGLLASLVTASGACEQAQKFRLPTYRIAVRAVTAADRWIDVDGTPAADGLVVLPAIDDGPFDRLEIGFSNGTGTRTVVRGVKPGEGETVVNVR